jgi:type III pantothenate kinase
VIIALDIGNTRIKGAVFQDYTLSGFFSADINNLAHKINSIAPEVVIISNVSHISEEELSFILKENKLFFIKPTLRFPFNIQYQTPHSLGVDRICLIAAAVSRFPGENNLVIDVGTCITYDFVNRANIYLGGAISPGLRMRLKAMHNFTGKLPLLEPEKIEGFVGDSTKNSMLSGVLNGILLEINGFIDLYQSQYGKINIIMTGGDNSFFADKVKCPIFASHDFIFKGMLEIYRFNA